MSLPDAGEGEAFPAAGQTCAREGQGTAVPSYFGSLVRQSETQRQVPRIRSRSNFWALPPTLAPLQDRPLLPPPKA